MTVNGSKNDLAAALDAIDLQLAADSDEVVLPRDAAVLVACALHDIPDLLAQAWDEGYRLDWTGGVRHPNPYRQEVDR